MTNTVLKYLINTVECFPDKIAFRDDKRSITFSELDNEARKCAAMIYKKLNGKTRQPIAVYIPKGVDSVIAFMSVLYSGNYYTPLDVSMPGARLKKILDILSPVAVLSNAAYGNKISHDNLILVNTLAEPDEMPFDSIINGVIDTDILYVMFTSGSTGVPKGVIVTHRGVIDYIDWLKDTFNFDENTIFGNQAPFYFDNSVLDIYSTIRNGCETVIIPEERFLSASRLCSYINEKNINTIFWVPSALVLVANGGVLEKIDMPQLKNILFAGEVMPAKQLNMWRKAVPGAIYANLYGPTEIAVDCTYYIVDRKFNDDDSIPIGNACKNTGIIVLNDNDEAVGTNEVGELCVRGSSLAHGYYGNPEKTREAFVQNPLNKLYPEIIYRTGDIVKYNNRGELLYVGRKDFQIKHMGYRIELGEIETAVSSVEGIDSCCTLYDTQKKCIVLFITPASTDKKKLYKRLKAILPQYMLPGIIEAEDELPLNHNGKIDRQALKDRL